MQLKRLRGLQNKRNDERCQPDPNQPNDPVVVSMRGFHVAFGLVLWGNSAAEETINWHATGFRGGPAAENAAKHAGG
jgi:hypothetical protein